MVHSTFTSFVVSNKPDVKASRSFMEIKLKQESPPAWTQEAYRPRRIKYSICYPRWGTSPGRGTPPVRSDGGYLRWGPPSRVPPPARSNRRGTRGGVTPQPGPMRGTWGGVPSEQGYPRPGVMGHPRWGTPWQDLLSGPGQGPPSPLGVDRQTRVKT